MSYLVRDIKANLLRAIEILEKVETGEKDECVLSQVDVILKVNISLLKISGHVEKTPRGRPKSENAMTSAERVRKHRQKKSSK
jgi:hypothetical protein